jgi:hypothetical protein
VQAVIDRFQDLAKQGLITGDALAAGLEKARQKIDDLKPGIQGLDEAMRAFGLQTQAQVQATADRLEQAYQQISVNTRVSLADLRKAFDQWAAAAIAANGGVESSAVKVARAMLEIKEQALDAGKAIAALAAAADRTRTPAGNASLSQDIRNAGVRSTLGTNKYDSAGNALDSNGNPLNAGTQVNIGEGEYFDQASYDRAVHDAFRYGSQTIIDPQRFVKPIPPTLADNAAVTKTKTDAAAALAATKAAGGSFGTVAITINGAQPTNITVGSQADARALAGILSQLEASARSAGIAF